MEKIIEVVNQKSHWVFGTVLALYAVYQITIKKPGNNKGRKVKGGAKNKSLSLTKQEEKSDKPNISDQNNTIKVKHQSDILNLDQEKQNIEAQSNDISKGQIEQQIQQQQMQQQQIYQQQSQSQLQQQQNTEDHKDIMTRYVQEVWQQKLAKQDYINDTKDPQNNKQQNRPKYKTKHFDEGEEDEHMQSEIDQGQRSLILTQSQIQKKKKNYRYKSDQDDEYSKDEHKIKKQAENIISEKEQADQFFFEYLNKFQHLNSNNNSQIREQQ